MFLQLITLNMSGVCLFCIVLPKYPAAHRSIRVQDVSRVLLRNCWRREGVYCLDQLTMPVRSYNPVYLGDSIQM